MKTTYLGIVLKIALIFLLVAAFETAKSEIHFPGAGKIKPTGTTCVADTAKHGRKDRDLGKGGDPDKIVTKSNKKDNEKNPEDGIDDDIKARNKQEFERTKDRAINRVPKERLIVAKKIKDQLIREKNQVKPGANLAAIHTNATINGLQWHERGPNNVGGRTRALIFDLNDAANGYKKVFAGGVGGGIWYTNDITATPVAWNKINDFFDNIAISCIVQDPTHPQILYAGTGEGYYNADAIEGLGVWKSTDDGVTWNQLTSSSTFNTVNSILVDKNGSVYIAGTGYGVEQSTDGGTTWNSVLATSSGGDLQLAANGDVYASLGVFDTGNIFVSPFAANGVNTGKAGKWINITPSSAGVITPNTTSWYRIQLACAPNNANIVYAFFTPSSTTTLNVNSVQQYNRATNTWAVKKVPPGTSFSNNQGWYSIALAVDPNNANTIYAGSLDAVRSIDGGTTWTNMSQWEIGEISTLTAAQYVHADHHAYAFAPGSSSRLMMGTDGGIFYTANANIVSGAPTFIMQDNTYDVTQLYSAALHPTNTNYFLAGAQDNGTHQFTAAGINATNMVTGGDGTNAYIDQTNGNIQITSYVFNNHWVSTDGGVTFTQHFFNDNGQFVNPSDYDPATKNLYSGDVGGAYFRWAGVTLGTPVTAEVGVAAFNGADVTAVTVSPLTPKRVYFGLDNGTIVMLDIAQTGTNKVGVAFNPNLSAGGSVSCITVDPTNENHILVSYFNYGATSIFETKNAQSAAPTWTAVEGNLPDMPVRWLTLYPGDATRAIIATELGVWTTDALNGAATVWTPSNSGLANVEVDMLTYRASDRTLAAATHGRGLFTTTLPAISNLSNDDNLTNLALSSGTLTPAFALATTSYTATVANSVTSITVTPTTEDANATVKVNGTTVASGAASAAIPLSIGQNAINTVVTAQDGTTVQTYTVTVKRTGSSNAQLSTLTTSAGALTPTFAPATTSYTQAVAATVTSITVTPTVADATATIAVNGTTVSSGTASGAIALSAGSNVINTVVTAQDGVTKITYAITVMRAGGSADASLSNLAISVGNLKPAFATGTTSYVTAVGNGTTSVTLTPTATSAGTSIKIGSKIVASGTASAPIPLFVGSNTLSTVVTAQNGTTTKNYKITVTRAPSSNAKLLSLTTSSGVLTPTFNNAVTSYTRSVSNATTSITLKPTAVDKTATITVNGTTTASGTSSAAQSLVVGSNVETIVVTAQNGTTTITYTVTVNRATGPLSVAEPLAVEQPAEDGVNVHLGVSPNGDGVNDALLIEGINKYPDNKLQIMTRSGQLVFEAKGYDNATRVFDGHSNKNGKMQLPGTYFYSLDYMVNGIVKHKSGFIVLKY